jgi:DNA primase
MARIPESEIERLKREISLERLASAKGIQLKKHGENLLGLCPFHDDREPSLVITPSKNLWHCLGACQAGGTVIDWVMRAEGVKFRHAVELLRADLPSLEAFPEKPRGRQKEKVAKQSTTPKLPAVIGQSAADDVLLRQVADYYHETLKQSPEALLYLQKRGLNSAEMLERFRLGYANRTLAYRLPLKNRKAGAEQRGQLQRLGVMRESGHEHLNGSLVIPIIDEQGRVTEMYGRKLNDNLREGTPKHLYLPGPHRGVWNEEALASSKEVILCESLIDALTFWCAGYRNVTTSYGVEGFTDDHRAAFWKHGVERVLIAYDRDEAGDRAAEKLSAELAAMGIEVSRVKFPKGMDANEYALKLQPAAQSLGLVLRQAEWMAGVRWRDPGSAAVTIKPMPTASPEMAAPAESPLVESIFSLVAESGSAEPVHEAVGSTTDPIHEAAENEVVGEVSSLNEAAREEALSVMATAEGALAPASPPPLSSPSAASPGERPLTVSEIRGLADELGAEIADNAPAASAAPSYPPSPSPSSSKAAASNSDEVVFAFGDRRWRVRGLPPKPLPGSLRVNLLVSRESGLHVDTLELYSARQRAQFTKLASDEVRVEEVVIKRDLGEVLLKLEEYLEKRESERERANQPRELSDAERNEALGLLRDPQLLERILADFERCGVVGERTNKLLGYLAATSRKLDEPLAVVIQSSSAAGKSSLMDAVLELMPSEERVQYSAMTGQSLFYMGESNLKHKILSIVEEEGAERASYALKILQSEGELTIASTGKDPVTGRLVTQEYHVEGPVMIFQTTTAVDMDEELLNRCLVLSVDEGREQTRAIHERQRRARTLSGMVARAERAAVLSVHQNAQRLLRRLSVVNPYAEQLKFPDHQTRLRRDHTKYLGLIEAIALLHQYQRPVKEVEHRGQRLRYIEVTKEDIATANRLAHEVLGRSLDELPPQTRNLLELLEELVRSECERLRMARQDFRFSRRELRERTGWGDTQLKVHLGRLVEMEYVIAHRGHGQSQRFGYELQYERGSAAGAFLPGLIAVSELGPCVYDEDRSGSEGERSGPSAEGSGPGRPAAGGQSGSGRGAEKSTERLKNRVISNSELGPSANSHPGNGKSAGGTSAEVVMMPSAAVAARVAVS